MGIAIRTTWSRGKENPKVLGEGPVKSSVALSSVAAS